MKEAIKKYFLPGILTAVFSLGVGLTLWRIQKEVVSLDFQIIESEAFPREGGEGRFFNVPIRNSGSKPIQNIEFRICFDPGNIDTFRFSDPNLVSSISNKSSEISGQINLLNPGETLGITITSFGKLRVPKPTVVARAVGITASPRTDDVTAKYLNTVILSMSVIGIAMASIFFWTAYRRREFEQSFNQREMERAKWERIMLELERTRATREGLLSERETKLPSPGTEAEKAPATHEQLMASFEKEKDEDRKGKPDTEQIIFVALNKNGLGRIFYKLMQCGDTTYRRAGFFLFYEFLLDQENGEKYIHALQTIVDRRGVSPASLGSNLYLLAKMEQFRGNPEKSEQLLDRCKNETPLMHNFLMQHDKHFHLEKLRSSLVKALKN